MARIVYPNRENDGLGENGMESLNRRPSALFNDDDFDYALELRPDDEYRQVAELLPDVVGFDEVEIDPTELFSSHDSTEDDDAGPLDIENRSPFSPSSLSHARSPTRDIESNVPVRPSLPEIAGRRSSTGVQGTFYYDHTITGIGTLPMNSSPVKNRRRSSEVSRHSLVTKQEFSSRLEILGSQKKWVERAARKSSLGFSNRFHLDPKSAMDRFLVHMARGVLVRRHQAYKLAEYVCLFSTTGCREICWEAPRQTEEKKSVKADRGVFDWCIAICGCGDDLTGEKDNPTPATRSAPQGSSSSLPPPSFLHYLSNLGYKRKGRFEDLEILALHPAIKEDPTAPGMLATESLRRSKDEYNAELTFSVIVADSGVQRAGELGYSTLDIECDDTEMYFLLLKGFSELLKEAQLRRGDGNNNAEGNGSRSHNSIGRDMWKQIWQSAKHTLASSTKAPTPADPVQQLFAPSHSLDLSRAWRVGGGFLSASSSPPKRSGKGADNASIGGVGSPSTLPIAQFLGWKSAGTQIWARLKMAGLDVKVAYSYDLYRVILKLKCPPWRLEQMAEQMRIKIKTRGGYMKPFRVSRRDSFIPFGAMGNIFRSSERQQVIDYILRSKICDGGAELDEHTELGKFIVQRFPLHMYGRLQEIRHGWVTFWKRETPGQIAPGWSPFSSSYVDTARTYASSVHFFFANILTQPLDNIAEYFGEGVAFYFAFMAFYTRWLVFPSILGVCVFAVQITSGQSDHILCAIYAVVVMIWVCFMLAFWRQKQSALAYKWGVLDYEVEETERPQFRGEYFEDELTGEVHKHYPMYKRFLRYLITIPVIAVAIFVILLIMLTVFYSQDRLYNDYVHEKNIDLAPSLPVITAGVQQAASHLMHAMSEAGSNSTMLDKRTISLDEFSDPEFWSVTFFYPSLYGILVSILNHVFEAIAIYLNEFENHRTQTTFINRLILKVFVFQFITIFTSLYYYLFFTKNHEAAYTRISVTIFSLMTVGTWWNLVMDIYIPQLYHRTLLYRMRANIATHNRRIYAARELADGQQMAPEEIEEKVEKRVRYLDQARSKCWEEALYRKYNNFTDYTTLVIQLSYILFFSAIFPLAPLLALFNNIILIRCHAYKICYTRQRPIATKIGGIGIWSNVLQILSMLGVLTNCALFGLVSEPIRLLAKPIGDIGLAIALFIYEQIILLFKYWLHTQVPSVPPTVRRAQIRERKSVSRKSILRDKEHKLKMQQKRKNSSLLSMLHWHNNKDEDGHGGGCIYDSVDGSAFAHLNDGDKHNGNGKRDECSDEDERYDVQQMLLQEQEDEEIHNAHDYGQNDEYEEKAEEFEDEYGEVDEYDEYGEGYMSPPPYSPKSQRSLSPSPPPYSPPHSPMARSRSPSPNPNQYPIMQHSPKGSRKRSITPTRVSFADEPLHYDEEPDERAQYGRFEYDNRPSSVHMFDIPFDAEESPLPLPSHVLPMPPSMMDRSTNHSAHAPPSASPKLSQPAVTTTQPSNTGTTARSMWEYAKHMTHLGSHSHPAKQTQQKGKGHGNRKLQELAPLGSKQQQQQQQTTSTHVANKPTASTHSSSAAAVNSSNLRQLPSAFGSTPKRHVTNAQNSATPLRPHQEAMEYKRSSPHNSPVVNRSAKKTIASPSASQPPRSSFHPTPPLPPQPVHNPYKASHSTRHLFPPSHQPSPFACIHDSPQFKSGGRIEDTGVDEEENVQGNVLSRGNRSEQKRSSLTGGKRGENPFSFIGSPSRPRILHFD